MAKEKKKTPLFKESIFIPLGILYLEDIPKFHIDGRAVTELQYKMYLEDAESKKKIYMKSPALRKLSNKLNKK